MAVHYTDLEDGNWLQASKSDWKGKVAAGEPDVQFRPFETASPVVPRGQLVQYEPGHHEARHSHEESEFLYVLAGEATLGDVQLRAGMLVHVEGGTEYGPIDSGPDGLKFLRLHLNG